MSSVNIYSLRVEFTPRNNIPLTVWNGMFLYRKILDAMDAVGIAFDHRAPKQFYTSPILDSEGRIATGLLEKDAIYTFKFTVLSGELRDSFIKGFTMLNDISLVRVYSDVFRVEKSLFTWDPRGPLNHVIVEARFYPTLFRFRGNDILYPSIPRLLMSIAQSIHTISGLDVRDFVQSLIPRSELLGFKVKRVKLSLGRDSSGRERRVKAFHGKATILFTARNNEVKTLLNMLKIATMLGVGKNRSLGLGHIELAKNEIIRISREH